jgi:Domain of unknown function (DUF1942)
VKIPSTRTAAFTTTATVVFAGFVGIVSASTASADQATDSSTYGLGSQGTLVNGDVVQGWTVSGLKPSTDAIPYPVRGTLWEATATDEAIKGYVIPIVLNLGARAPSGQTYRALYQVATPQGVNPATLAQGQKTTGKVYFDVTGDGPDGVVYNAGGQDLASWVQARPSQPRSGAGATTGPATGPVTTPVPAAAPAPAGGQQTPPGAPATTVPARSQGPRTSGSQGTPIPGNNPAPPAPEAGPPPPTPGAIPAPPAPEAGLPSPAPAGGQEASAGSPTTPAPAGGSATPTAALPAAPAPAGSQGSAGSPATPTP